MIEPIVIPVIVGPELISEAKTVRQRYVDGHPGVTLLSLNVERDDIEFEIRVVRNDVLFGDLDDCCWAEVVQFDGGQEIACLALHHTDSVLDIVLDSRPLAVFMRDREFIFKAARLPACMEEK